VEYDIGAARLVAFFFSFFVASFFSPHRFFLDVSLGFIFRIFPLSDTVQLQAWQQGQQPPRPEAFRPNTSSGSPPQSQLQQQQQQLQQRQHGVSKTTDQLEDAF